MNLTERTARIQWEGEDFAECARPRVERHGALKCMVENGGGHADENAHCDEGANSKHTSYASQNDNEQRNAFRLSDVDGPSGAWCAQSRESVLLE